MSYLDHIVYDMIHDTNSTDVNNSILPLKVYRYEIYTLRYAFFKEVNDQDESDL